MCRGLLKSGVGPQPLFITMGSVVWREGYLYDVGGEFKDVGVLGMKWGRHLWMERGREREGEQREKRMDAVDV